MNGGARLSNLTRIATRQPPIGGARMRDPAFYIVWLSFSVGLKRNKLSHGLQVGSTNVMNFKQCRHR